MPKVKKSPEIKYGIEITKPHSKEMYDHNDMVSSLMKKNILNNMGNSKKLKRICLEKINQNL